MAEPSLLERAKAMYAERPVYRGTKRLSWYEVPAAVRREWLDKAKATAGVTVAPGAQEPIPDRVYWAPLSDNFYSAEGHGMGLEFYRKWKPRRAEFPQGESFGWGPGSAHNPFKDQPRAVGVRVSDELKENDRG